MNYDRLITDNSVTLLLSLFVFLYLSVDNSYAGQPTYTHSQREQWEQLYADAYKYYKLDIDKAIATSTKAGRIALEIKDVERIGKSHWMTGWLYRRKGDLVNSFNYYLGARKAYLRLEDWDKVEQLEENLGSVALDSKSYDIALQRWKERLETALKLDQRRKAFAYYDLGLVYYYQKDYEQAIDLLVQAKAIFHAGNYQAQDSSDVGRVFNLLGLSYSQYVKSEKDSEFELAMEELNEATKMDNGLLMRAMVAHNKGKVYSKAGAYALAEENFQRALLINSQQNNLRYLMTNLVELGSLYYKAGEVEKCLEYLVRVFDLDYNTFYHMNRDLNRAIEMDVSDYLLQSVEILEDLKLQNPEYLVKNNELILDAFKRLMLNLYQLEEKHTADLMAVAYSNYEASVKRELFWADVKLWGILLFAVVLSVLLALKIIQRYQLRKAAQAAYDRSRKSGEDLLNKL